MRPSFLFLLLFLLPIAWYFRRSLVAFARPQKRSLLVVRGLTVILLALAVAGLNLIFQDDRQYVVFLVDCSESLDESASERADRFIADSVKHLSIEDRVQTIDFAAEPSTPRETNEPALMETLDRGQTDLESALNVAWASIPNFYSRTLVVLSDGRATRGDVLHAAQAAHSSGARICTVSLPTNTQNEVQVSDLVSPAQIRSGTPFELQINITSNHAEENIGLDVFRNDIKVGSKKIDILEGTNRYSLRQVASSDKLQSYSVRVYPQQDRFTDNNTGTALISCEGKGRVLLIGPEDKIGDIRSQEPHLVRALEGEDIEVRERGPRGVPRTLDDLDNFDLLVFSDVPADSLDKRQMQIIRSYVQNLGGGFVMLGGEQSFGLGGYYKTILEEILPVRSDFEKEKEKPSLAMVLVIDKSGSMGGQKIELAKEAAKSAVELLGPRDQVGVVAFDGGPKWISELHSASDKMFVTERISSLVAGGGTNLAPALSDAFSALETTNAKLKHVIALSDGHSQPGNFYDVVSSMASARITVSTVAVGAQADRELLERIADWGNGRTYFTTDPSSIPQIFARETMEASKSAINEQPFLPVQMKPHQICEGINLEDAQFLLGYVITRPKPTAELILATEAGHPLLATWRYGLGKSLAWTSDASNRWAANWLQWSGFSRFWAQVVRDTMRTTSHGSMQIAMDRKGQKVQVKVDALHPSPQRQGEYLDDVQTTAQVIQPGRPGHEITLQQVQPGQYVGEFELEKNGTCHLRFSQKRDGVEIQAASRGLAVGYSDEYRVGETDETLLRQIASVGGGIYNPDPAKLIDPQARSIRVQPLWPYLLIMAIILLVLDVALRRIDFSMLFGRAQAWPPGAKENVGV